MGVIFTTENRNEANATGGFGIEPDARLEEEDISIFFYYWLNRIPQWRKSGKAVMDLDIIDFSLHKIWGQSFSRFQFEITIEQLKKGVIFKFDIEYKLNQNIAVRARKYFISLCPNCKKSVNIHLSRPKKLCPYCSTLKEANEQRLRRAIKKGRNLCENCGKPLPKKYPNRKYCPGGKCKQQAYRNRENKKWYIDNKDVESVI